MRVALLSFGQFGGAGQYPAKLANGVAKHAECYALVPSTHTELEMYDDSVNLVEFPVEWEELADSSPFAVSRTLRQPTVMVEMLRRLRAVDPDVVHLPFYFLPPSILSVPLVKTLRKPVVATLHDPHSHEHEEKPFGVDVMGRLRKLPSPLLDRVIVHGEDTYRQAASIGYDESALRVIPHGTYDQFGQSDGAESADTPTVLFFGHLRKYRGTDRLPAIADALADRRDEFRIQVAGTMDDDRRQTEWARRTLAALHDHPRIDIRDEYVPNEEVGALFDDASIALLPYYEATMSGVVMTAYSFATPLVATDTGDIGWMIEKDDTGLLAKTNSAEEIAAAVDRLLSDDDLRARLRSNIRGVRDQYSWENIGASTVELYEELVEETSARSVEAPHAA